MVVLQKKTVRHLKGVYLSVQHLDAMTCYKKISTCTLLKSGWSSYKNLVTYQGIGIYPLYKHKNLLSTCFLGIFYDPLTRLQKSFGCIKWIFFFQIQKRSEQIFQRFRKATMKCVFWGLFAYKEQEVELLEVEMMFQRSI